MKLFSRIVLAFTISTINIFIISPVIANDKSPLNASSQSNSNCELTYAWQPWAPVISRQGNLMVGAEVDLLAWIAKEIDCKIIYKELSWQKTLESIKHGRIDFAGSASYISKRKKFAYFSTPYIKSLQVLTIREEDKPKFSNQSLVSLLNAGFKLGIIKEGFLDSEIEKLKKDPQLSKNISYHVKQSALVQALETKVIDGFFELPFAVDNLKMRSDIKVKLTEIPLEIVLDEFRFIFSKKSISEKQVLQFNSALKKIKQSKHYKQHPFWSTMN